MQSLENAGYMVAAYVITAVIVSIANRYRSWARSASVPGQCASALPGPAGCRSSSPPGLCHPSSSSLLPRGIGRLGLTRRPMR